MDEIGAHPAPLRSLTSRRYETDQDLQQMQALLMEASARAAGRHYPHVGDLTWTYFILSCHLDPHEHIRLWHDAAGTLVGYAILGEDPSFECQVLPEYAWSGIEAEALAWVEERLVTLRRQDADRWSGNLVSGAMQDDAERIAFLEQHGLRPGAHVEVHMLRSLHEPIGPSALPPGCRVRAVAGVEDVSDRAAIQREVWQPWYVSRVGAGDYARLMHLPAYERDLDVVAATPEGVIASYVNGWLDPVNRIGDFGPVGARPAYRRQGLTRAVLLEGLRRMQARGMDRVCVSTGESNAPALRLYASIGFKAVNQYFDYVITV
jgi:ribosomal protein S18 acetylase RimI-like enzyme